MSKATKRKYVTKEVTDEFVLPDEHKEIVRVVASRGNNLHEVETTKDEKYLVSMPTKFRKNVWIKRGDFVLVEPIDEGDKVKAEIVHILYKEQIKYIKEEGKWPSVFDSEVKDRLKEQMIPDDMLPPSGSESDEDDNQEPLTANPNRPLITAPESDSDSEISDEDQCGASEVHVTRYNVHFN